MKVDNIRAIARRRRRHVRRRQRDLRLARLSGDDRADARASSRRCLDPRGIVDRSPHGYSRSGEHHPFIMTFDVSDFGLPHRMLRCGGARASGAGGAPLKPARTRRAPNSSDARFTKSGNKRSKHDHRSRIPRARRAGLQPHPARRSSRSPTSTRRCRCTSSSPTRATRSCSSRWSAASGSAAIRSSGCRRRCAFARAARDVEVIDDGGVRETFDGDPLAFVESYRARFHAAPLPGLPRFCGGLAGIFGYDVVRHIETRLARLGQAADAGTRRHSRPAAAAHRRARGRRQPEGQDLAHRLRRSGAARGLRAHARSGWRSCAASCASR